MDLPDVVARTFQSGGPLGIAVDAFSTRVGQTQMAVEIARTMDTGGVLVVEAGTGVGKTFAYLIPALLSGQRVLISTATKALQDQLFKRDIPRLQKALGVSARVAQLKGRSSYLCLQRLEEARLGPEGGAAGISRQLAQIEVWARSTRCGDLAELDYLDEASPSIPLVTSTRDNCLGARCPHAQACHVNQARRAALAADLVVVNHHLFFADLNIRESGVAELLPTVRSVIFDEAHQLSDVGVQFLGQQFSTGQLDSFVNELLKVGRLHARGLVPWDQLAADLSHSVLALRALAGPQPGRRSWRGGAPEGVSPNEWVSTLTGMFGALASIQHALSIVAEVSPDMGVMQERAQRLEDCLAFFRDVPEAGYVRWMETGHQVRLVYSPLDIAHAMQTRVMMQAQEGKSWIFTSATLGHDATLSWFVRSCGLSGARVLQVPSPFNYKTQAALYVPDDLPWPGDENHSMAVAQLAAQGAALLGGRTLVLTTSLRAMRNIGSILRETLDSGERLQVLVQGETSKRELVERFCSAPGNGGLPCVLVASASFWEGIDIPGEALQLLVIDKLPFTPPDDPLHRARADELEATGKSPFKELHLPQAAVALKQGAGRLIRRESDCGVLVVCDTRLVQMGYGKKLIAALPDMQRLNSRAQWLDALSALTRPSTTDPC
ncbi:MAG: ATP-dependent DNA helicase [Burkholderiales bacterium]|nr:ATP-dependent DNA helicase [Burkholderiales bacterium]